MGATTYGTAAVPFRGVKYAAAGKTGTAQIPSPDHLGYIPGAYIGSFAGFAPAQHPVLYDYIGRLGLCAVQEVRLQIFHACRCMQLGAVV